MKSPSGMTVIGIVPVILVAACAGAIVSPATREGALWMLKENHPVELLTFIFAIAVAIVGLGLARQAKLQGEKPFVVGFFIIFSLAFFFLGMEEIAWGQQFLGFASPAGWSAINAQGETTLHNVVGVQGRSEIFRFLFGLSSLAGILAYYYWPFSRKIGVPMVLLPWAIVIAVHTGIDVFNDYFTIGREFDYYMQRTSELIEMLIAISGLIYIMLKSKMFSEVHVVSCADTQDGDHLA